LLPRGGPFCWAHVRRDFLAVLTGWPELTDWALQWVEEIGTLYQRNDQRLALKEDASAYAEADRLLRAQAEHMRQSCDRQLAEPKLRLPQRKALESLQNHWAGLTVFVDHPKVPMDNNEAERRQRGPVVARKNYYGSGTLWSGRLPDGIRTRILLDRIGLGIPWTMFAEANAVSLFVVTDIRHEPSN
jgi:transposase